MPNHHKAQHDIPTDNNLKNEIEALKNKEEQAQAVLKKKIPLLLKIFAILCIIGGVAVLPMMAFVIVVMVFALQDGTFAGDSAATVMLFFVELILLAVLAVVGFSLIRRNAVSLLKQQTGLISAPFIVWTNRSRVRPVLWERLS